MKNTWYILALFFSSSVFAQSVPISGVWRGVAKHVSGNPSRAYSVELSIDCNGKSARGIYIFNPANNKTVCHEELWAYTNSGRVAKYADQTLNPSENCHDGFVEVVVKSSATKLDFKWKNINNETEAFGTLVKVANIPLGHNYNSYLNCL